MPTPTDAQLQVVFSAFDADGSGKIDQAELSAALTKGGKKISQQDVTRLLQTADKNDDQQIDFEEFKAIFALAPDAQQALGLDSLVDISLMCYNTITAMGKTVLVDAPTAVVTGATAVVTGALGALNIGPGARDSPEARLVAFVHFAIGKLEAAAHKFEDDTPEEDYKELTSFAEGMSRNLKAAGAGAGAELRDAIRTCLLPVWDIGNDTPGKGLRAGGAIALKTALKSLLAKGGPLEGASAGYETAQVAREAEREAAHASDTSVRPASLASMSLGDAVGHAWSVDKPNRMEYGTGGFTLALQSKRDYNGSDRCKWPLFESVDTSHAFWRARTTRAFVALLDNYEREVGKAERQTAEEKREEAELLNAVCATQVMRFAFEWLKTHGKDPRTQKLRSMSDFQTLLFDLWLAPYRRVAKDDSSGFEHVFVGEEKGGEITGLHNWVQYYLEEKKGTINYLGWTGRQDSDYDDDVNLVTVKFAWDDNDPTVEVKPMSTFLCGSTVEWEMAALTMAFLGGNQNGDNCMALGNESILIKCYSHRTRFGAKIATAYIELAK